MVLPSILAWVEVPNWPLGFRVRAFNRGPLMGVAERTGQREVREVARRSGGPREYVINGEGGDLAAGGQVAVFAPVPGAGRDLSPPHIREGAHARVTSSGHTSASRRRATAASSFSADRRWVNVTQASSSARSSGVRVSFLSPRSRMRRSSYGGRV